jgi:hypothetical protein
VVVERHRRPTERLAEVAHAQRLDGLRCCVRSARTTRSAESAEPAVNVVELHIPAGGPERSLEARRTTRKWDDDTSMTRNELFRAPLAKSRLTRTNTSETVSPTSEWERAYALDMVESPLLLRINVSQSDGPNRTYLSPLLALSGRSWIGDLRRQDARHPVGWY